MLVPDDLTLKVRKLLHRAILIGFELNTLDIASSRPLSMVRLRVISSSCGLKLALKVNLKLCMGEYLNVLKM